MKENHIDDSSKKLEARSRCEGSEWTIHSQPRIPRLRGGQWNDISSDEERLQSALQLPLPVTDFSLAAFKIRELIGVFLNEGVREPERIGFCEKRVEDAPALVISAEHLLTSFMAMRAFLEGELVRFHDDDCITQIYCDTYNHIEDVIEITRKATGADSGVSEEYVEPLAFELLEFRAVLVSKALELGAHIVGSRVQADISVNTIEADPDALILTISEDSLLHEMLKRQEELRKDALPNIQKTALTLVQHLLTFIETLRNEEAQPFGFDRKHKGGSRPISGNGIVDNLRDTLYQLDDHFQALSEETPMDINFRAYIHNMTHFIGAFRIALIRQMRDGCIPEGAVGVVLHQAQHAFREVTQAVKQLTTIANVDLFESVSEGVLPSAGKVA